MKRLIVFFSFFLVTAIIMAGGKSFRVKKSDQDVGSIALSWEAPTPTNSGGLCYKIKIVNYSSEYVSGLVIAVGVDDNSKSAGFELEPRGSKYVYVFTTDRASDFTVPVIHVR